MSGTEVYKSSSIKRRRRTQAEVERLKDAIVEIVSEHQPMTIRQLFYQMVSRQLIDKTEAAYNATVIRLATVLRREGRMPYSWIADNTRWMRKPKTHSSIQSMLEESQQLYRRDLWQDQDAYVEIWLEKDALAGVLLDATHYWDVPLMVCRGYASLSYLNSAANQIRSVGKPAFLYYFGDCDPSGRDIPRSVERNLRELAPDAEISFKVVAVTDEQIDQFNLPTRPTKGSDSRAKSFNGRSVEVDAIPPKELVSICRACIEQHLDDEALERHNAIQAAEEDTLRTFLSGFSA